LEFSATPSLFPGNGVIVVLTLDEKGKSYKAKRNTISFFGEQEELPPIPKRVLDAFTENAIDKILSKDEIPNESGMVVLDGNHYEITITKDDLRKEYDADDASIETYPLLRYLASWYRRQ
jgi:DNA-binding response OmpR family regulator